MTMRSDTKKRREAEIEAVAYALLDERGYAGLSMLSVAKAARASNETLYRWFGDKRGLFKALVRRNADQLREILEDDLAKARPPLDTMRSIGPLLLELVVGPKAIALNRAAAADPSGELGAAIAEEGRDKVVPLLTRLVARAQAAGHLRGGTPEEVAEIYVRLLIGDLQIRRAIGVLDVPPKKVLRGRADDALAMLQRLFEESL